MALNLQYSSQFIEHLEAILLFYDERKGSDNLIFEKSRRSK